MSKSDMNFFLGANSPAGFASLYGEFADEISEGRLFIIKGGPGCGKSTFMKRIADALRKCGYSAEYIRCSGDPDSLDAVYFPELQLAYADGTAPHALEPLYHGVSGEYVCLGEYCDSGALTSLRGDIESAVNAYRAKYRRAYSLIEAADAAVRDMYGAFITGSVRAGVKARADAAASRELKKAGGASGYRKRFLGALTHRGRITFFDTVPALAERVYAVDGEFGLSSLFLENISEKAISRGYDCILCPDEAHPERLRHLIIPSKSLAFVTHTPENPYPGEISRRFRLDALAAHALTPADKKHFRVCRRLSRELENEAVSVLSEAKTLHDELERIYNPHVDFEAVCALADRHAEMIS